MNVKTAAQPLQEGVAMPNNLPAIAQQQPRPAPVAKLYPTKIAKAIIAVTREIGRIKKDGENTFQHYKYARWDDVVERLSPLLADNGLIIVQSEQSRSLIEENEKGSTLAIVYEFTLIHEDGDQWPAITWSGYARLRDGKGAVDDKAGAKCHTQAEKYFCIKQFKIRTGDAIDSDAGDEPKRYETLPKAKSREIFKKLETEMREAAAESLPALRAWMADSIDQVRVMADDFQDLLRLQLNEALAEWKRKEAQPVDDEPEPVAEKPKPTKGDTVVPSPKRVMEAEIAAQQAKLEPAKPTLVENATDPLDLPNFLDRRKGTFDERAWQIEVGRRIATAASTDELVTIQAEICTPNKRNVSEKSWNWHVGIIRDRMAKIAAPVFDATQWLKDVDGACAGCEDAASLEKVKNGVLLPGRGKAPQDIWEKAVLTYKRSVDRVTSTDTLSAG